MPKSKAQKRKQKEKRGRDKNNGTTNSSSSTSQSQLTSSNATSPSPPNPSSPKINGNGRDETIPSKEEIAWQESEREKKEMEEEKRVEERETEPETKQVVKEILAKSVETGTGSADLILQGEKGKEKEKEKEKEKGDEDTVGPTVQGEKKEEVSEVEIVDEKKKSIATPIEVVTTTQLVGPSRQGLETVVKREIGQLEAGKAGEVTVTETPGETSEREQTAEVANRDFPVSMAKRATWWNCCGLLDVFSGSSR